MRQLRRLTRPQAASQVTAGIPEKFGRSEGRALTRPSDHVPRVARGEPSKDELSDGTSRAARAVRARLPLFPTSFARARTFRQTPKDQTRSTWTDPQARPSIQRGSRHSGCGGGRAVVASAMAEPRGDESLPQTPPSRSGWSSEPDPAAPRYPQAIPCRLLPQPRQRRLQASRELSDRTMDLPICMKRPWFL